ncbi:MAG: terpene cyclase/mutase family protein [Clostridia bacterium]|nr:terpene cyclase/mutase family protein [Clostridia bacterium]
MKRLLVIILCISVLFASFNVQAIEHCVPILSKTAIESPGSSHSDWAAIALCVSGYSFDKETYKNTLTEYIIGKYATENKLHAVKSTEWHRIILAANLLGMNAENINGINLVYDGIYYRDKLSRQGVNGYIWALIALSSGNFSEPADAINTKQTLINNIVSNQKADGGFSLSGTEPSCDLTAMAVYALAPYKEQSIVANAINNALNFLVMIRNADGTFSENGVVNSESVSQIIIALSALGEDVKNNTLFPGVYDILMQFSTNEGFSHEVGGEVDIMATYQAVCAIASITKSSPVYENIQPKQFEELPTNAPTEISTLKPSVKKNNEIINQHKKHVEQLPTEYISELKTINAAEVETYIQQYFSESTTQDETTADIADRKAHFVFAIVCICVIITLYLWRKNEKA